MIIGLDFDGVVVSQERSYTDVTSPLVFMPGAREGLAALKAAGHTILLYSARACLALRTDPQLDPLVRAGVRRVDLAAWKAAQELHEARYQQMVAFVEEELTGLIDAIDDGRQGKPAGVDLFIDDRVVRYGYGSMALGWDGIARLYGDPMAHEPSPRVKFPAVREGLPYSAHLRRWRAVKGVQITEVAQTSVGPVLAATLPGSPVVAVLATQHGDETVGALMLYQYAERILDVARAAGVGLVLFPCVNPEGYEHGKHETDNDLSTNWVIMYEVAPGKWETELKPGQRYMGIRPAKRSKETVGVVDVLARLRPAALLDLHQDSILPPGYTFAYTFGDRTPYRAMMARLERDGVARPFHTRPLKNSSWSDVPLVTDDAGLVELRDGSFPDWAWRQGVKLSFCVEVSTRGSLEAQMGVALGWVEATIEQVAQGSSAR